MIKYCQHCEIVHCVIYVESVNITLVCLYQPSFVSAYGIPEVWEAEEFQVSELILQSSVGEGKRVGKLVHIIALIKHKCKTQDVCPIVLAALVVVCAASRHSAPCRPSGRPASVKPPVLQR